tara:strand:+ start:1606 stop:1767 length:162 start_codon:yes stop_codon:yes gene_type:complete
MQKLILLFILDKLLSIILWIGAIGMAVFTLVTLLGLTGVILGLPVHELFGAYE